jgi:hypothetical protein
MNYKYDLSDYIDWCATMGLSPLLPTYLETFRDNTLYSSRQIAKITGVSKETVLRMYRNRELMNESMSNTYKSNGMAIKNALFNRPSLLRTYQNLYPEFFNK